MIDRRFILLLILVSSFPSAWAMGHTPVQRDEDPLIGKVAPDIVLPKSDGTSASVVGSRQGKKAIIIFWATWCPNCYGELGYISDNLSSIEQKGIKVVLVDIGENREQVQNYFNRRQMKLVSFVDGDSVMQESYHLIGVPTLIFIDENGIVRSMTHEFPADVENYFSAK